MFSPRKEVFNAILKYMIPWQQNKYWSGQLIRRSQHWHYWDWYSQKLWKVTESNTAASQVPTTPHDHTTSNNTSNTKNFTKPSTSGHQLQIGNSQNSHRHSTTQITRQFQRSGGTSISHLAKLHLLELLEDQRFPKFTQWLYLRTSFIHTTSCLRALQIVNLSASMMCLQSMSSWHSDMTWWVNQARGTRRATRSCRWGQRGSEATKVSW